MKYPEIIEKESVLQIKATVKNTGNTVWLSENKKVNILEKKMMGVVNLGIEKWIDNNNKPVIWRDNIELGARGYITVNQYPGDTSEIILNSDTPQKTGEYTIILDMVDEYITWFYKKNKTEPKKFKIRVADKISKN